jgi:hypothetical protein
LSRSARRICRRSLTRNTMGTPRETAPRHRRPC